jgi:prephenate dehydratase
MDIPSHTVVAIQGIAGSFHDEAAAKCFPGGYTPLPCETFRDMFIFLKKRKAEYAVMAIENTVAGTILPNYALLRNSEMAIIGEVYLAIRQNLLALPGQKLEQIKEVHSHPMAIQQCQVYFEKHPQIRLVETSDTAASASWIAEHHNKGFGAIASKRAAHLFGLQVLAAGIETDKRNFTRFLVLHQRSELNGTPPPPDKASLAFHVPHTRGSLARVLTVLAEEGCNLTKIQSLPVLGREWEYYMHIDLEFDSKTQYHAALAAITPHVHELTILGEYPRGKKNV